MERIIMIINLFILSIDSSICYSLSRNYNFNGNNNYHSTYAAGANPYTASENYNVFNPYNSHGNK